eukprot:14987436-Alexandrium_andersonii.AAC.1
MQDGNEIRHRARGDTGAEEHVGARFVAAAGEGEEAALQRGEGGDDAVVDAGDGDALVLACSSE